MMTCYQFARKGLRTNTEAEFALNFKKTQDSKKVADC